MSHNNTRLDFSEKAKRINGISPLAYESSRNESKEEPMNTNQDQTYNMSIPYPLAEILLNILARASAAHSNKSQ